MVTEYSKLAFHTDLSSASGKQALNLIGDYLTGKAGEYFLALEGAIPWDMPEACVIGDKTLAEHLLLAAKTMSGAVAVGMEEQFGKLKNDIASLINLVKGNGYHLEQ